MRERSGPSQNPRPPRGNARRATGHAVAALAEAQFGVVSRAQLLECGVTRSAIGRAVEAGRLRCVHARRLRGGPRRPPPRRLVDGRRARARPGAVLSHRTAAAAWGIHQANGTRVDVSIPTRAGRGRPGGIALHRPRALQPDEVTTHAGLPITTPARTLIDLADVVRPRVLATALAEAERARLDVGDLAALLDRHPAKAGAARVRRALAGLHVADDWTRSELERRFLRLCTDARLPQPAVNTAVAGMEVDFCWRDARVVVEADGAAYHRTRAAFEEDHRRDVALRLAGFDVLRVTHRQLVDDAATVTAAVRAALALGQGGGADGAANYAVRSRAISSKTAT